MSLLDTLRPLKTPDLSNFVKVLIGDCVVGWTKRDFAKALDGFDQTWNLSNDRLMLNQIYTDHESRTKAIDDTFVNLSTAGHLPVMPDYTAFGGTDWLNVNKNADEVLCVVKRFYLGYLGLHNHTVILNGYTGTQYWAAQRSQNVHDHPGTMDIIAAGAVTCRHTVYGTLLEEANQESGLTEKDLATVKKIGVLKLYYLNNAGFLSNEDFHVFDLDTGPDLILQTKLPIEVAGFKLLEMDRILPMVEQGNVFKWQINLVMVDFLLRHGYLDRHPELSALKKFLYEDRNLEEFVR